MHLCFPPGRWVLLSAAFATPAFAQDTPALAPVVVSGHYDNAVGTSDAASQGTIRRGLIESRPALRPAEVLEYVPGLIVTQHSGDGKANQYFLRGFNLDHGTDFATWVNGMPVNMPTHGHGQGYTDLNFLIPEFVDRIDYLKGPYFADVGDFASSGAARIAYVTSLAQPEVSLTLGQDHYVRGVFGGSSALSNGTTLFGGLELAQYDGPWAMPMDLKKANGLVSWSGGTRTSGWSVTAMAYHASWDSTDQVPLRAIEDGTIDRFGAIDPTDGGETSRQSLSAEWRDRGELGGWRASAYVMHYDLDLFSNFTYALDRPATGDQFHQSDERNVVGGDVVRDWVHTLAGFSSSTVVGGQLRHDRVRVGLYDTQGRKQLGDPVREDRVRETTLGLYAQNTTQWTDWFRSVAGLRATYLTAEVDSADPVYSGKVDDTIWSPKLSFIFGPWEKTEFFVNAGRGFHSNDARGMTDPVQPVPALVVTRGGELGIRTEVVPGLQSSLALWQLDIGSELVYIGDAGNTEAGLPSRRRGIEWNNRWIPVSWLLFDADLAWTHARFDNGERIPGAPERVASVAASVKDLSGWSGSIQLRYLGPRALVEDNSVRAGSSLLTNLRVARRLTKDIDLTLDVFNLFDRDVNDIEYWYESQLGNEAAPVADRHIHPAEPRTARLTVRMRF
jgi:outer membrane receptor protein involved in Fe transport